MNGVICRLCGRPISTEELIEDAEDTDGLWFDSKTLESVTFCGPCAFQLLEDADDIRPRAA